MGFVSGRGFVSSGRDEVRSKHSLDLPHLGVGPMDGDDGKALLLVGRRGEAMDGGRLHAEPRLKLNEVCEAYCTQIRKD